ncbi:MAG: hypothetical protein K9J17_09740 [Flavobacteriales bacterium]|nr:hypothetical protein [Flavobacteriales bacterium]
MSNYTFTKSSSYALNTHSVSFTNSTITVKLSSTGTTVFTKTYGTGVAFMCQKDNFCIGTLSDNGVFTKVIDFDGVDPVLKLIKKTDSNRFVGSDNETDPGVQNTYNINKCPVRLVDGSGNTVKIECPCESSSGPCGNNCYTYG